MQIRFKARQTPFNRDATEVRTGNFDGGATVGEIADSLYAGFGLTHYAVNGRRVEPSFVPGDGDEILGWCVPKDPVSGFIAGVATWIAAHQVFVAVVLIAANIGLSALMARKNKAPKYRKPLSDVSDEQYGWNYNASNAVEEGAPIPCLYGKRMVLPPTVMARIVTDSVSNESFISNLYGVCEGGSGFNDVITYPHDDPSNDMMVADLNHARWWSYLKNKIEEHGSGDLLAGKTIYKIRSPKDGKPVEITGESPGVTDGDPNTSWSFKGKYVGGVSYIELPETSTLSRFSAYMKRGYAKDHVMSFSIYARAGNSERWVLLANTGTAYESHYKGEQCWQCNASLPQGKSYRQVCFKQVGRAGYFPESSDRHPTAYVGIMEMELFGEFSAGGLSDRISLLTTDGGIDSSPLPMMDGTWASLPVEKFLDSVPFSFSSTRKSRPDRIGIHLSFPYGLYQIDEKTGDIVAMTVKVEAFIQGVGADGNPVGEKTGFFESDASVKEITDSAQREKNLYYEKDVTSIGADSYMVTVRFAEPPKESDKIITDCKWSGLDEGWDFSCVYPRTALAGMKALATKSLSGSAPQFRILAERKTVYVKEPVWDEELGRYVSRWSSKPASNPAWAAYDLLVHPVFDDSQENQDRIYEEHRNKDPESPDYEPPLEPGEHATIGPELYDYALAGYNLSDTSVDLESFARWAKFCDDEGITCSMYYDGTTRLGDAIRMLLDIGRASLVNQGSTYGVWVDRKADATDADGNPLDAYVFDDSNIVADSWSVTYGDTSELPSKVNVTFYDREREWNRYTVSRSLSYLGPAENILDVNLYACDDRGVAERHADYLLKQRLATRNYAWTGNEESIPLEIGDIVKVKGDYAVITSVTLDDRLQRQFTAVEYARDRFA